MTKLLDSLTSGFQAEADATIRDAVTEDPEAISGHKDALEMYAFLLHWFVAAAENVKSGSEETAPVAKTKPKRGRGAKAGRTGGRTAASKKNSEQWSWQNHIPNALGLICRGTRETSGSACVGDECGTRSIHQCVVVSITWGGRDRKSEL